jgi:hypothetical protein
MNPYREPAQPPKREDDPCPKGKDCVYAIDPAIYDYYLCINHKHWPACKGPFGFKEFRLEEF